VFFSESPSFEVSSLISETPRQAWSWTRDCCRRPPPCGGQLLDPPQAATLSGSASQQDFVQERVSARHVWPFFSEPQGEEASG
jgi:hypothetical protein